MAAALCGVLGTALLGSAGAQEGGTVEWPVYGGSLAAQHYSPLDQINAQNVKDLEIAWRWYGGNFGPTPEMKSETTPLMIGGVLYATAGATRNVVAINAGSGELALRLGEQTTFDAVVCDARLLSRDGTPIAGALQRLNGCANARFVLSAPSPLDSQVLPTTIDGATLVARPYDVEELRRLIEGD